MNEEKRERSSLKKQKTVILIVIASLTAFAALYFLIGLIDFDSIFFKNTNQDGNQETAPIVFYDESYSKYPSEDDWYMNEAFKNIEYVYGTGTIFRDEIQTEQDAKNKNEALLLLYKFIEYIKDGDHEGYNDCFSANYFESHERQGEFTKQKIYDIVITEIPNESDKEYTFSIEYRIRHNNGSLRKDIGSDQSKKQYVKISPQGNSELLIDDIY